MRKYFNILLFALSATIVALTSCTKENVKPTSANIATAIDYSKIKKTTGKNGSMLVFESWEHFYSVRNSLMAASEANAEKYLRPLIETEKLDEEALNERVALDGFNQFQPVHEFCNNIGFESYYQVAEKKELEWMNQNVEKLDEKDDPFANIERYESALLNPNGLVMIGGEIYTAPVHQFSGKNTSCEEWTSRATYAQYWYTTSIKRLREIKGNVGISPFQAYSSSTTRFRRLNGTWAFWFTSPGTRVYGKERYHSPGFGCSDEMFEIPDKASNLPWGFYVYQYSWHGKAPAWAIKFEGTVKSQHGAPGYAFNHYL